MSNAEADWHRSPLLTDLYQFTMMQGYVERGMMDMAVFEFFVRRLPENRNFLIAAGLEQSLQYLENLRFSDSEISFLRSTGLFGENLLKYLSDFAFTGDVDAVPEGTVFFANEPILRVVAPLPEAQLVESRLVNLLHFQSLIASKAARCVLAAPGKLLVDFGMRRAHGEEAAVYAARASYLAGFAGTATVIAKKSFDIPIFGTMAHSFIQAHDSEIEAFENFVRAHRGHVVLLIDTYDTEEGARHVVQLAHRLRAEAKRIQAIRLDSGDLLQLSRRVRRILDEGGCPDIGIFASSSLDEYALEALLGADAPIDGFGIGTHLDVSEDAPALDCVYKIQEYAGRPRRKRSTGKATWPGRKQVFRQVDASGRLQRDILSILGDEQLGQPLLEPVMRNGKRISQAPNLESSREYTRRQLDGLPPELRSLTERAAYPVGIAHALEALALEVDNEFR
jgi:nicotinate phosphoribosyltransferase